MYPLALVCPLDEGQIIRLPPFDSAETPRYIESEGDECQHHYEEPVPKESDSGSMKGQLAVVDKGVL